MDKEQLLREIFELEPDLRSKENEVRTLVFSMLEHKPRVFPDVAAKFLIRARLMAEYEAGLPKSVPSPWSDWLWYMAPLGVAAVIVLMMVPGYTGPSGGALSPHIINAPVMETIQADNAVVPVSSRTAKMEMVGPEGADARVADIAEYQTESVLIISLMPQKPGNKVVLGRVVTDRPVFAVVQNTDTNELIGLSGLILPGNNTVQTINLSTITLAGANYQVVAYADDGDGLLGQNDSLVLSLSLIIQP
jgi:hypothetical protein